MHWKAGVLGMNQKPDTGIPCQGGGGDHHFTHHHHHHYHHCHPHHQHQCYYHHRHRHCHHELLNHRICTECLSCFLLHNSCQSNMEMVFIGCGLFIGVPFVDLSVWFVTYLQWLTLIWPNSKQSCVCEWDRAANFSKCTPIDNTATPLLPVEASPPWCSKPDLWWLCKIGRGGWFRLIFWSHQQLWCTQRYGKYSGHQRRIVHFRSTLSNIIELQSCELVSFKGFYSRKFSCACNVQYCVGC